jgi:hypothetical protein
VGFGPLISPVKSPVRSRHTRTTEQNRLQLPSYILSFWISMGGKTRYGENAIFAGVSAIPGCIVVVNRGELRGKRGQRLNTFVESENRTAFSSLFLKRAIDDATGRESATRPDQLRDG